MSLSSKKTRQMCRTKQKQTQIQALGRTRCKAGLSFCFVTVTTLSGTRSSSTLLVQKPWGSCFNSFWVCALPVPNKSLPQRGALLEQEGLVGVFHKGQDTGHYSLITIRNPNCLWWMTRAIVLGHGNSHFRAGVFAWLKLGQAPPWSQEPVRSLIWF